MSEEENYEILNQHNRLILAWLDGEVDANSLKSIKRIMTRVLNYFPSSKDRKTIFGALECMPIELAREVFSDSQVKSKKWICEALKESGVSDLGKVYVLGGWCGLVNRFLQAEGQFLIESLYSFDLDKNIQRFADILNGPEFKQEVFKAIIKDVRDLNFLNDEVEVHDGNLLHSSCSTIINTSCEHMDDTFINHLPEGVFVIAQTNNHSSIDEHTNCSDSLNDFEYRLKLSKVIYKGELELDSYKRFMIIGYK